MILTAACPIQGEPGGNLQKASDTNQMDLYFAQYTCKKERITSAESQYMSVFLKVVGAILIAVGVFLAIYAFRQDVNDFTVCTNEPFPNQRVLHFQLLWALLGGLVAIAGTVCTVGGTIVAVMRAEMNRPRKGDETEDQSEVAS